MPKTMLIDATHDEETRVAIVDGQRLVEFDYESKVRKQLKGSIFLAKVTRVEPSLQAAFVNFGGNRHGFLPFSEIHPDYFRIPVSDREALLAAQMAELEEHDQVMAQVEAAREEDSAQNMADPDQAVDEEEPVDDIVEVGGEDQPLDDEESESPHMPPYQAPVAMDARQDILEGPLVEDDQDDDETEDQPDLSEDDPTNSDDDDSEESILDEDGHDETDGSEFLSASTDEPSNIEGDGQSGQGEFRRGRGGSRGRGRGRHRRNNGRNGRGGGRYDRDSDAVDSLGGDSIDSDRPFRFNLRRSYKIQEVIKRGQIMLIQVSKEERGNKGAAVTTYLSLPGRYCVLMPNSPRGGGVSRKIASFKDRQRMKEMLDDLPTPDGMSVILRTAGVARTPVEIKRDLDYLTRLWNAIREHTLKSSAPSLIYEEGSLVKRAIRDLYTPDVGDIYVSGNEAYTIAKDFMHMLMPSHAKKVQDYTNERIPLFHKFGVENQIADIGEPLVSLRSGGYLVINPTEALVSIDVNSGRATKERHIEETALKTNLEAADELARQLRLRDLGGLVVVDFIDMEDRRNNRKVEQRLRDALSHDRARIQVGRISSFGLLELSRQRLNPSLAEAQMEVCKHCNGTGRVRTLDFSAISLIRALEAEGIKGKPADITLTMASSVAIYLLNNKRRILTEIENRYDFSIQIVTDDSLSTSQFTLDSAPRAASLKSLETGGVLLPPPTAMDQDSMDEDDFDQASVSDDVDEGNAMISSRPRGSEEGEEGERGNPRRRRRGRRGGRGRYRDRDDQPQDGQPRQPSETGSLESSFDANDQGDDPSDQNGTMVQETVSADGQGPERQGRGRQRRFRGRERGDRTPHTPRVEGEQQAPRYDRDVPSTVSAQNNTVPSLSASQPGSARCAKFVPYRHRRPHPKNMKWSIRPQKKRKKGGGIN